MYSTNGSPSKLDAASTINSSSHSKYQRALKELRYVDPTDEMNRRWLKVLQKKAPTIDLVDVSAEVYPFNSHKR